MSTTVVQTKTYGEVRIHHNSDWSGNVIVTWTERCAEDPRTLCHRSIEFPATLILIMSGVRMRRYVRAGERLTYPTPFLPNPPLAPIQGVPAIESSARRDGDDEPPRPDDCMGGMYASLCNCVRCTASRAAKVAASE